VPADPESDSTGDAPAADDVDVTKFPAMVDVLKTGAITSVAWIRTVGAPTA